MNSLKTELKYIFCIMTHAIVVLIYIYIYILYIYIYIYILVLEETVTYDCVELTYE